MAKRKGRRRRLRTGKFLWVMAGIMGVIIFGVTAYVLIFSEGKIAKPDELLITYMDWMVCNFYSRKYGGASHPDRQHGRRCKGERRKRLCCEKR